MSKADSPLPSYEESLQTTSNHGQTLLDQMTLARAEQIRTVIDEHIYPILRGKAIYGIAKTAIALVPSESTASGKETESSTEIIGTATDEEMQMVRLQGGRNRVEFWRQAEVVEELRRSLWERLGNTPLHGTARVVEEVARTGLWGQRKTTIKGVASPATATKVEVKPEELYLRAMSEFGLYETITRLAIVIRIDANA